jgi:hypothetical protein
MAIYKELSPSDFKQTRSSLNQLVDVLQEDVSGSVSRKKYQHFVTGGVGPGVTSSLFQTVYDQDFTLQAANPIFDVTVGLYQNSQIVSSSKVGQDSFGKELFPSSSLMMREKMDIYREFAQQLLGDGTLQFFSPPDSVQSSDGINAALFITFKRLFSRDQLKRESYVMRFYQTASLIAFPESPTSYYTGSNIDVTTVSGSAIYTDVGAATNKLVAPGGQFAQIVDATDTSRSVGLIYYDSGIVVLDLLKVTSASQFMSGTIDALTPTGRTVLGDIATETGKKAAFSPDFLVSASLDNIIDHICAARFQSGSMTAATFQNITSINSMLVFCTAGADEFNYSSNPTYTDTTSRIVVIDPGQEDTQRAFSYITGIGLYDANDNLLAMGKVSRPIEKDNERQTTLRLRLDFAFSARTIHLTR